MLVVRLVEARDLTACAGHAPGLRNPFIQLKFGPTTLKSKTVKKSLNPTYDELFLFKVPSHIPRARPPDMVVECFDWVSRQEDICLGRASVSLKKAFTQSAQDKWYMLSGENINKGYFRLQFMFFLKIDNDKGLTDESAFERMANPDRKLKKASKAEVAALRESLEGSLQSTVGSSTSKWSTDELGYPVPDDLQYRERHMDSFGRCQQSRQLDRWIALNGVEAVQPDKNIPTVESELFWNGIPSTLRAGVYQKMEPEIVKQCPSVIFLLAQPQATGMAPSPSPSPSSSPPSPSPSPALASTPPKPPLARCFSDGPPRPRLQPPTPNSPSHERSPSKLTSSMRLFRRPTPGRRRHRKTYKFRGSAVDCRSEHYRDLLRRVNLFTSAAFPGLEAVYNTNDADCELEASVKIQIEKDVTRTFPTGFSSAVVTRENAMAALKKVLSCYAVHNKRVGYCQSLNLISGFLLCQFEEETAFWLLVMLTEYRLPDYYSDKMEGLLADFMALEELLSTRLPKLMQFMKSIGVTVDVIAPYYLLTVFVMSVPSATAQRIMDLVICVGSEVLLMIMVVFLRRLQPTLLRVDGFPGFIEAFKAHLRQCFDAQRLISQVMAEFSQRDTLTNEIQRITKLRERCLRRVQQETAEEARTEKILQKFKTLLVPSAQFEMVPTAKAARDITEAQRKFLHEQKRLETSIKLPEFLRIDHINSEWHRLVRVAKDVLSDTTDDDDDPEVDLRSLSRAQFTAVCKAIQEKIQPGFRLPSVQKGEGDNAITWPVASLTDLLFCKELDATARVDFHAVLAQMFFRLHFWSSLLPRAGPDSTQSPSWPPKANKEVQTIPTAPSPLLPSHTTPKKRRVLSYESNTPPIRKSKTSVNVPRGSSGKKISFWKRITTPKASAPPSSLGLSSSRSSPGRVDVLMSSCHSSPSLSAFATASQPETHTADDAPPHSRAHSVPPRHPRSDSDPGNPPHSRNHSEPPRVDTVPLHPDPLQSSQKQVQAVTEMLEAKCSELEESEAGVSDLKNQVHAVTEMLEAKCSELEESETGVSDLKEQLGQLTSQLVLMKLEVAQLRTENEQLTHKMRSTVTPRKR